MKRRKSYVVVRLVSHATGRRFVYVTSEDSFMQRILDGGSPAQVYGLGSKMSYAEAHTKKREMQGACPSAGKTVS